MSTNEAIPPVVDEEAVSDVEKARCRRNRRQSVQFIDKNLIRRRSLGYDKFSQHQQQSQFQQSKLQSISAVEENEPIEKESERHDCEHFSCAKRIVEQILRRCVSLFSLI